MCRDDRTECQLNFLSVFSNLGGFSSPFTNEPLEELPRAGGLRAGHPHPMQEGDAQPLTGLIWKRPLRRNAGRGGVSVFQGPRSLANTPLEIINDLHGKHQISLMEIVFLSPEQTDHQFQRAATAESDKTGQRKGAGEKEIKATGFLSGKHNLSIKGAINDLC